MEATNKAGHVWTGEKTTEGQDTFWHYIDSNGSEYQSREIPAYRIDMRHCGQRMLNGKPVIVPHSIP